MRHYYFFRHAKADATVEDLARPLTDQGMAQAKAQALVLADVTFDLVICSNALRTQQTADLLLQDANPVRIINDNLCHPIDKALRQGIDNLVAQYQGDCLADYQDHDTDQYYTTYAQIVCKELEEACEAQQAKCVLIVGHAYIINGVAAILAPQHRDFLTHLKLKPAQGFRLKPEDQAEPQVFVSAL